SVGATSRPLARLVTRWLAKNPKLLHLLSPGVAPRGRFIRGVRARPRRDHRSLPAAVAAAARLARMGDGLRTAGLGVGTGGNVPRVRPVHGLGVHWAARRRDPQAEFSQQGSLFARTRTDGADTHPR